LLLRAVHKMLDDDWGIPVEAWDALWAAVVCEGHDSDDWVPLAEAVQVCEGRVFLPDDSLYRPSIREK